LLFAARLLDDKYAETLLSQAGFAGGVEGRIVYGKRRGSYALAVSFQ
jgi:hypothetical protein